MDINTHEPKSIKELIESQTPKKQITKARCQHQHMMEMVIKAGFAPTMRYQGMWARVIKNSGINDIDLKRLIEKSQLLDNYCPRGFVRNRLQKKDWINYL